MDINYADYYRELGLKIAFYRKMRGMTQATLAERIGRTPAFVGHIEAPNIKKGISLDTLFNIAAVLNVPAYKFIRFETEI